MAHPEMMPRPLGLFQRWHPIASGLNGQPREPHDGTLRGSEITPCHDLVSVPMADRNP